MTGFQSAAVKQEGAASLFDTAQEGYTSTYVMETISMGFALTQEAFEDNLYDRLSTRYSRELGRAMRNTIEAARLCGLMIVAQVKKHLGGDLSRISWPTLTTVVQPLPSIAADAVSLLKSKPEARAMSGGMTLIPR